MSPNDLQESLFNRICNGNTDAKAFLTLWAQYVHAIDDVEDVVTNCEFRQGIYIMALELYTSQFFLKNLGALKQVIYTVTNMYADSENMKNSHEEFSKWASHCAVEMFLAVACITGGYRHMRSVSEELRIVNWSQHHGK